jgi:hypothetical protein
MKKTLKKISDVCKLIFGYGIAIVLFAGGLTFFGYMIALIIGGETATAICTWIYKKFVPIMVYATTILILFGLLSMYLAGEKALTPEKKKKKDTVSGEAESETSQPEAPAPETKEGAEPAQSETSAAKQETDGE